MKQHQNATSVARRNLEIIANDSGLGATNAGYCHIFAPFRTFMSDPEFIRAIRYFKSITPHDNYGNYYYDNDMLNVLFGENWASNYKVNYIVNLAMNILKHTDKYGNIINEKDFKTDFYEQLKKTYPYIFSHDLNDMSELLTLCMAFFQKNLSVLQRQCLVKLPFDKSNKHIQKIIEQQLDEGKVIMITAAGNHHFNVYKKDGYYYTTGGIRKCYDSLEKACHSWYGTDYFIHYIEKQQLKEDRHLDLQIINGQYYLDDALYTPSTNGAHQRFEYYILSTQEKQQREKIQLQKENYLKELFKQKKIFENNKKNATNNWNIAYNNRNYFLANYHHNNEIIQNNLLNQCIKQIDNFTQSNITNKRLMNLYAELSRGKNV